MRSEQGRFPRNIFICKYYGMQYIIRISAASIVRRCVDIHNIELALEVMVMEESVDGLKTDTIGIGIDLGRSGTVALVTGAEWRKSLAPTSTVLLPNKELLVVTGEVGCCCCGLVRLLGYVDKSLLLLLG